MGKMYGHTNIINEICIIDNRLWSCSSDESIRLWSTEVAFFCFLFFSINGSLTIVSTMQSLQCLQVIKREAPVYSITRVGPTIWCGENQIISVWNLEGNKKQPLRVLKNIHTDKIVCLLVVWDRIVWSASSDQSICIWS